ncbi:MAG: hypothetical protein BHW31_05220 [Firmicutes bacterium CAG:110_56_8]|nr:MAG: hypothetical protein BHW31_05220 [Firmicutes bacterium CAG:110_56_8]
MPPICTLTVHIGGICHGIILFLDKMVNTILSCESFAGRRWRREMYGLTFFAAPSQAAGGGEKCMDLRFLRLRRGLLKQQPNKTVFNRFIEN